jgi:rhamnosyltransferase
VNSGELAGVVVAYRPGASAAANIASYRAGLGFLAIVDNSPGPNPALRELAEPGRCAYLWDGRNQGMAAALNLGAGLALERGADWLLTMDQDSRFAPGALERLAAFAREREGAGIVSPWHRLDAEERPPSAPWEEIRVAMTSGNLLDLRAYRAAGPFLEKLFIDYVDHEYCLRLRRAGYRNFRVNGAVLEHSLGSLSRERFLAWTARPTHHSAERRYYTTRNRLFVMREYPAYAPTEAWFWVRELGKMAVFEKDRYRKLKYMAKGLRHFLGNRYGPLDAGAGAAQVPS